MKRFFILGMILMIICFDSFAQSVNFSEALKINDTPDGLNVGRTIDWMIQSFLTILSLYLAIGTAWKFKEGDYEYASYKIIGIICVAVSYSVAKVLAH